MMKRKRLFCLVAAILFTPNIWADQFKVESTSDESAPILLNLRQAIINSNDNPGRDTIMFEIAGEGRKVINLSAQLPLITDPVFINGTSQPGYNGVPLIEVNGSEITDTMTAGFVLAGGNIEIKGIAVYGFNESGVKIISSFNLIYGCLIGLNSSGNISGNNIGIEISRQASTDNKIGGKDESEKNIISGNHEAAILINAASSNFISGNYIGANPFGVIPGFNRKGIEIINSSFTSIGGLIKGEGNEISGNLEEGILISSSTSTSVYGNIINSNGSDGIRINEGVTFILDNAIYFNQGNGIRIASSGNIIGGVAGPFSNRIYNNNLNGILITSGRNNSLQSNLIYSNGGENISFGGDIFPNDPGDVDTGPNDLQNFPELISASADKLIIEGRLNSAPGIDYTIEFFAGSGCSPGGYGSGEIYLGSGNVHTDANGNADFIFGVEDLLTPGNYISATATDFQGNTSIFSRCILFETKTKIFGNHYVINKTLSGIPLHWANGNSNFNISNNIPQDFHPAIQGSYNSWNGLSKLNLAYSGVTNSAKWGGNIDGINNNVWVTSGWEDLTSTDGNTIAVTRIRYNAYTGEITDADIAYNAEQFLWSTDLRDSSMDIQNAATHEAGHFFGLGDIYNPGDAPYYNSGMGNGNEEETMYGIISFKENKKSNLNEGDINGIEFIYNNSISTGIDIVMLFDISPNYTGIEDALEQSKKSAVEIINRLSPGDRIGIMTMPDNVLLPLQLLNNPADKLSAINLINNISNGAAGSLGRALEAAQELLQSTINSGRKSVIFLFGTGAEQESPFAADVLPEIAETITEIYTIGLTETDFTDQENLNSISFFTDGEYSSASGPEVIGDIVNSYFAKITGLQFLFNGEGSSDDLDGVPFPGIRWQGAVVDSNTTEILPGIRWQGSDFDLTLEDPDGVMITKDSALTNPGIQFFEDSNFEYFIIKNPKPGEWIMFVSLVEAPEPERYSVYMLGRSDIVLENLTDKNMYGINDTIKLEVKLSNGGGYQFDTHVSSGSPITNATVTANIISPEGKKDLLLLSHIAAGVYRGTFTNTSEAGNYLFNIKAERGSDFSRQFSFTNLIPATDPVLVKDEENINEFSLLQNYPNPFNPATNIQYTVGSPPAGRAGKQFVSLKVYDILGNEVAILVNEEKPAGEYNIKFNTEGLSSGVYIYTLTSGGYSLSKKLMLVK